MCTVLYSRFDLLKRFFITVFCLPSPSSISLLWNLNEEHQACHNDYERACCNSKKLFGTTPLDVVRANIFDVPVIGGHVGITILPRPSVSFTDKEVQDLTVRIQNAGTEVVEAKAGAGSATLSMVYAARFVESSLRALDGDSDVPFFTSRIKIGKEGVEAIISADLQGLIEYETKALNTLKPELKSSIEKGVTPASVLKLKPTTT